MITKLGAAMSPASWTGKSSLDALKLNPKDYVIAGSAAAMLHGLKDSNDDIDILVKPKALEKLIKSKLVTKTPKGSYSTPDGKTDMNSSYMGSPYSDAMFSDVHKDTKLVGGYPVLSDQGIRTFYEQLYAKYKIPKHKAMLERIRNA